MKLASLKGPTRDGTLVVVTRDLKRAVKGAGAARNRGLAGVRLTTLVNDVSFRRLIPAELAKGFGFVNGKGANALAPVAVTPDELGALWKDGRVHLPLVCAVNGRKLGSPNAGADGQFGLPELIATARKTGEPAAGTMIGTGTVSNQDLSAGYACLMEARLVEQVETGAAKTPFLDFGDTVKIEMLDTQGASVFGAIEHGVERYRQ